MDDVNSAASAAPPEPMIRLALEAGTRSPCRSKRGVVLYSAATGQFCASGHNSPPAPLSCPGRAICAGTCAERSVHAEVRAIRKAMAASRLWHAARGPYHLVHVELAADGDVVACSGPRCPACSKEILDVGFVAGVWLFELCVEPTSTALGRGLWRRYSALEFHRITLERCGMTP